MERIMEKLRDIAYKALRRSEAFFKTDMVYLAKGGFWLTLIQVFTAASSFILSIFFAHYFSKDSYGTYKYVIALAGIVSTISLTGLGPAVAQSAARNFNGALDQGFIENLKWSWGIILISLGGCIYYFLNGNSLLAYSFLLIGVTAPLTNSSSLFNPFLNGKKDFKKLATLTVLRNLLPAISLLCALYFYPHTFFIIFTFFISSTLANYIAYLFARNSAKANKTKDPEMLTFAKHLSLLSIFNSIADQLDKVIVYHYIGAVELAIYVFATAIPTQLKGVLKGFYSLALPKFASRELGDLQKTMLDKMIKFLIIIVPVVILYIIAAPWIYQFFFPKYTDAIRASQIYSLSLIPFISVIPSTTLQAKKIINGLYGTSLIFSVIKILFLAIGVSTMGFWGVVYARVAYEYVGLGIYWWYAKNAKEAIPSTPL